MVAKNVQTIQIKDDHILLSSSRIGAFFGVTRKTMAEWKKAGCPQVRSGWWDLDEVYKWRVGLDAEASAGDKNTWAKKKLKAEAEYKAAKADQEKIRLKILEGDYVQMADVITAWAERLAVCRVNMFSWIHTLPPLLEGMARNEIDGILDDEIRSLWEAYSKDGPFTKRPEKIDDADTVEP